MIDDIAPETSGVVGMKALERLECHPSVMIAASDFDHGFAYGVAASLRLPSGRVIRKAYAMRTRNHSHAHAVLMQRIGREWRRKLKRYG